MTKETSLGISVQESVTCPDAGINVDTCDTPEQLCTATVNVFRDERNKGVSRQSHNRGS